MNSSTPRHPSTRRILMLACLLSLLAHGVLFGALSRLRGTKPSIFAEKLFAVNLAEPEILKPTPRPVPTNSEQPTPPPNRPTVRIPTKQSSLATARRVGPSSSAPHRKSSPDSGRGPGRNAALPGAVSPSGLFAPSGDAPPDNTPHLPAASGLEAPRATQEPAGEAAQPGNAPRPLAVEFNTRNTPPSRRETAPPEATPDGADLKEPPAPRGPRKARRGMEPEATPPPRPTPTPEVKIQPEIRPAPMFRPEPEVFVRAKAISEPKPDYPDAARDRNQQGNVQMRLEIDANGAVTGVTVTQSSGHSALDEAALRAARRWKYQPARRGETPVPSSITRTIKWTLEE